MESIPYRQVLRLILFVSTRTRPDIATVVSMLGKFQEAPLSVHWRSMESVVPYLVGTQNYGLMLPQGGNALVEAWSNAYWAREKHKRRSRSDYIVTIGAEPVVWA